MGCDIHMFIKSDKPWLDDDAPTYTSRHYKLFAQLSGVRCYGEVDPLFEGRGWDEKEFGDCWDTTSDLHSKTMFTLQEILDVDPKKHYQIISGLVSRKTYDEWKKSKQKQPESYCQGVGGGMKVVVTEQEYKDGKNCDYIMCSWKVDFLEWCEDFWDNWRNSIKAFNENRCDFNKVKIYIAYDN